MKEILGHIPEIIISVILVAITIAVGYFVYYTAYGRYAKEKKARKKGDGNPQETEDADGNMKWGVPKDSYCYPSINDVMGYEFVKIIKVESKEGDTALSQEKIGRTDTRGSRVRAVPMGDGKDPEEFLNEINGGNGFAPEMDPQAEREGYREEYPTVDSVGDEAVEIDMPNDEISALQSMDENAWPREDELDQITDEDFDNVYNNNQDMFLPTETTEEDHKTAMQARMYKSKEEMDELEEKLDAMDEDFNNIANDIINSL